MGKIIREDLFPVGEARVVATFVKSNAGWKKAKMRRDKVEREAWSRSPFQAAIRPREQLQTRRRTALTLVLKAAGWMVKLPRPRLRLVVVVEGVMEEGERGGGVGQERGGDVRVEEMREWV